MRRSFEEAEKEFVGKEFTNLKVIRILSKKECNNPGYHAECKCNCGKMVITPIYRLLNKHTQSCGCFNSLLASQRNRRDLLGLKFGKLLVLKEAYTKNYRVYWECLCDCGKIHYVKTVNLTKTYKPTRSCGCVLRCKGKDHFNWDSSIPLEDRLNKRGVVKNPEYCEWIKKVIARDNYKCIITGATKDLEIHHLYGWNKYPKLRFEVDNGVTLAKPIHKLFHKIYKSGNNTKEQFEQFKLLLKKQNTLKKYFDMSCFSGACSL